MGPHLLCGVQGLFLAFCSGEPTGRAPETICGERGAQHQGKHLPSATVSLAPTLNCTRPGAGEMVWAEAFALHVAHWVRSPPMSIPRCGLGKEKQPQILIWSSLKASALTLSSVGYFEPHLLVTSRAWQDSRNHPECQGSGSFRCEARALPTLLWL